MPEGPEVKLIGEGLARAISGKNLISVEILTGRYTKKPPSDWNVLKNSLPLRVIGAGVHGKFCYWLCDNEIFVYSTLGMTGSWNDYEGSHPRLKFNFSDNTHVYYNDQRNFGTIKIVSGRQNLISKLTSMGPDMLSEDVSDQDFIERIKKKPKWGITKAIMDQSIIAGVGNYVKSESLWLAKINPHRKIADISIGELAILNRSIKKVLRESYSSKGTTIKSYSGFSTMLKADVLSRRFLVYGQEKDPEGNKVIREETADGRTTHWCREVQI